MGGDLGSVRPSVTDWRIERVPGSKNENNEGLWTQKMDFTNTKLTLLQYFGLLYCHICA